MPFPKLLLRKRLCFVAIGALLLGGFYFYKRFREEPEDDQTSGPLPVFQWIPIQNISHLTHCRNSQQGHTIVVDELGFVCHITGLLSSGCCDSGGADRFECRGCLDNGCCSVYEHCVSCCLHPNKQPLLRSILNRAMESFHPLYSSLKDQFELCLSKCRTSSQSVQHENSYRNPRTKYCYGTDTATLLPEVNVRQNEEMDIPV